MTAKEAAESLKMTVSALMRHVSKGNIPANRSVYPMEFDNNLIRELAEIKQRVVSGDLISIPSAAKILTVSTTKVYNDIDRLSIPYTRLYGNCGPVLIDQRGLSLIRAAEKKAVVRNVIPEGYAPIKTVSEEIGRSMAYLYKQIDRGMLAVIKRTPERPYQLVNIKEAKKLAGSDVQYQSELSPQYQETAMQP